MWCTHTYTLWGFAWKEGVNVCVSDDDDDSDVTLNGQVCQVGSWSQQLLWWKHYFIRVRETLDIFTHTPGLIHSWFFYSSVIRYMIQLFSCLFSCALVGGLPVTGASNEAFQSFLLWLRARVRVQRLMFHRVTQTAPTSITVKQYHKHVLFCWIKTCIV